MRLKEIVLAVGLASCAGLPKTTRTPGADGTIGNLPETRCPENFNAHVEQVGAAERIAVRACLSNDIPDIRAHCKVAFSGSGRYGGEPVAIERNGIYMWNCQGMATQAASSRLVATEVKSGLVGTEALSGLKAQEVQSTSISGQTPPKQDVSPR